MQEIPFFFDCRGSELFGMLAVPERPVRIGVVIVVGGPQYRVGSHRQFALLARDLAGHGFACLRFDYRGMGDSEGPRLDFEQIGEDIRAAIDALMVKVPEVEGIVLWGLCDAAAANAFYAATDPRVVGLALFNPWVRTEEGQAAAVLRHYYAKRLFDSGFWRKLAAGEVELRASAASLWRHLARAIGSRRSGASETLTDRGLPLPERFAAGLARHAGPVLIVLSGNDAVAAEFRLAAQRGSLGDALARTNVEQVDVQEADHTFSSARWRSQAAAISLNWLQHGFVRTRTS